MKKKTVLANFPIRLPIQSTILYTFLLHYFNVDSLYWGIFITLYSIYWILVIAVKWSEERIDLDDDKLNKNKKAVESKFAQRLQKLMNERPQNGA